MSSKKQGANKRRNKVYRPKASLPGGGLQALVTIEDRARRREYLASPLSETEQKDIRTAYWLHFGALTQGEANETAWMFVVTALNIGVMLCERGIGPELLPELIRAQEGAFRAHLRAKNGASYRLDGDGIVAIRAALLSHELQLEHATHADMDWADQEMRRRMMAGDTFSGERVDPATLRRAA
jgi:hypothetical protein